MLNAGQMLTNKRAQHSGKQRQTTRQASTMQCGKKRRWPRPWGPGMAELENAGSSLGDLRPCRLSRVNGKQQMCFWSQIAVPVCLQWGVARSGMGRRSFGSPGYETRVPCLPERLCRALRVCLQHPRSRSVFASTFWYFLFQSSRCSHQICP